MTWLVALAVALVAAAWPAYAESSPLPPEDAAAARAEFIASMRLARQGDPAAQWRVGSTYARMGEATKALPWLESAARSGITAAAGLLGSLFEDGRGIVPDSEKAASWYRQAAESGDVSAMAALARLLPASSEVSEGWALRAAQAGNADAQYWLGIRRGEAAGSSGREDGYKWLAMAAAQGHRGAQVAAATMLMKRKPSTDERSQAIRWLRDASDHGDPVASFLLGATLAEIGSSESEVIRRAYTNAARAGHREARYRLGELMAKSKSTDERKEALKWLEMAWADRHVLAANLLGELLLDGVGGKQQESRARALFSAAAEQGNLDGMYNLARMQQWGLGGERDSVTALRWYARAAEGEHARAMDVMSDLLGGAKEKNNSLNTKGFWQ